MPHDSAEVERTRSRERRGSALAGRSSTDPLAERLCKVGLGDEEAFSSLYDETAPLLLALIRQVARDVSASENVLQEVFVEVWKTASRFDPRRKSARAWIWTIAHRRAVNTVRTSSAPEGPRAIEDNAAEFQQGITSVEAQRVRIAMRSLTPLQSDATRLAYFGGYNYREVAALLGISDEDAKRGIHDGIIVLRNRLGVIS